MADKSKCQLDLKYVSTVKVVTIRGRKFCQSIWKVTFDQLLYTYQKHCQGNPDFLVLKGTFFNLKTFYAQNSSKKIWKCVSVNCICIVHGQQSLKSLLQLAKRNNVDLDATNYRTYLVTRLVDGYTHGRQEDSVFPCENEMR